MIRPEIRLIDCEQYGRLYPATWESPSEQQLRGIAPGDRVKIGIEFEALENGCCGERFWCRVERRIGQKLQVRVTQADMLHAAQHGVHDDDVLIIDPRHVLSTMEAE